jgi:hypothetical protein
MTLCCGLPYNLHASNHRIQHYHRIMRPLHLSHHHHHQSLIITIIVIIATTIITIIISIIIYIIIIIISICCQLYTSYSNGEV